MVEDVIWTSSKRWNSQPGSDFHQISESSSLQRKIIRLLLEDLNLLNFPLVDCSNVSTNSKLHLQPMTTRLFSAYKSVRQYLHFILAISLEECQTKSFEMNLLLRANYIFLSQNIGTDKRYCVSPVQKLGGHVSSPPPPLKLGPWHVADICVVLTLQIRNVVVKLHRGGAAGKAALAIRSGSAPDRGLDKRCLDDLVRVVDEVAECLPVAQHRLWYVQGAARLAIARTTWGTVRVNNHRGWISLEITWWKLSTDDTSQSVGFLYWEGEAYVVDDFHR